MEILTKLCLPSGWWLSPSCRCAVVHPGLSSSSPWVCLPVTSSSLKVLLKFPADTRAHRMQQTVQTAYKTTSSSDCDAGACSFTHSDQHSASNLCVCVCVRGQASCLVMAASRQLKQQQQSLWRFVVHYKVVTKIFPFMSCMTNWGKKEEI